MIKKVNSMCEKLNFNLLDNNNNYIPVKKSIVAYLIKLYSHLKKLN